MFNPNYAITDRILQRVTDIERLSVRLAAVPASPGLLQHLRKLTLIALTHYSNQIEGNLLSLEQVSDLLEHARTFGRQRDEREVRNYFQLLGHLHDFIDRHEGKMAVLLVQEFQRAILDGIVEESLLGKFRVVQNAVYNAFGKIVYIPPEANDVPVLLEELCAWVNTTPAHPAIVAAVFHYQFVTIHPYLDGNGRCARSLSLYLLAARGFSWREWVPVDRFYALDRKRYYDLLQQDYSSNYYDGRCQADFSPWIDYYLEGIEEMLRETLERVEGMARGDALLNNRQVAILKQMQRLPAITAAEYARRFGISTRMAARDLSQLVGLGKVVRLGKGRAVRYMHSSRGKD